MWDGSLTRFRFFFSIVFSWIESILDFLLVAGAFGLDFFFFFFLQDKGFGCFFFFFFNVGLVSSATGKPSLFFIVSVEGNQNTKMTLVYWNSSFARDFGGKLTEFLCVSFPKSEWFIQFEFHCLSTQFRRLLQNWRFLV